jgi:precorrin-6A/cobalt-precorrin-6A reductase
VLEQFAQSHNYLWVIGGTSDSATLVKLLCDQSCFCLVTVTTISAIALYAPSDYLQVKVASMNLEQMHLFCLQSEFTHIIDCSHPFAVEVSRNAIATANQLNLPYLRYERPTVNHNSASSHLIHIPSFDDLFNSNYLTGKRILLTIGIRYLPLFKPWQKDCTLFVRILPNPEALKIAAESGFTSDRIIALRPPISEALEKALWQHWQLNLVITKASGKAGGEDIKFQVAEKLKIPLIIIDRPEINYPQQTSELKEVLKFIKNP